MLLSPRKRPKNIQEYPNCFGYWTVFKRWSGVWLCTRDGRHKAGLSGGWCHPKYLFLSLDLWCKDLVLKKEDKTVLDNGLSLCADQVFDFVQEMGGIKLTLQGVGVTQKSLFLSLGLWCKDLVPRKRMKLFWTMDCLHVLIRCLTLYKRWEA